MRLDVGLHGVDAELGHASGCGLKQRCDGLSGCNGIDVIGAISDQQSFRDRLIAVDPADVIIVSTDPGSRRNRVREGIFRIL
jgi:hypothetical protein